LGGKQWGPFRGCKKEQDEIKCPRRGGMTTRNICKGSRKMGETTLGQVAERRKLEGSITPATGEGK